MAFLYILVFILFVLFSDVLSQASAQSFWIIKNVVFKNLFPMMVLSRLISHSELMKKICKRLSSAKIWCFLDLSDALLPIVFSGLLSGFPTSSIDIEGALSRGEISQSEASKALALSSAPSPAFVILVVFDSRLEGVLHYFTMVVTMYIVSAFFLKSKKSKTKAEIASLSLPEAISQGVSASVNVSGNIIFFVALNTLAAFFLPFMSSVFSALSELTSGVLNNANNVYLLDVALGLSGLSALMQIRFFAPHVCVRPYILTRIISATALIFLDLSPIFLPAFFFLLFAFVKIFKSTCKKRILDI